MSTKSAPLRLCECHCGCRLTASRAYSRRLNLAVCGRCYWQHDPYMDE